MATHTLRLQTRSLKPPRIPLLTLLHPREQAPLVVVTLALGLLVGWVEMTRLDQPLWVATSTVLVLLLIPGVAKWRADARRYGLVAMTISILVTAQGFHTVEHITQFIQYHVLNWTAQASTGLLSAANSEVVHFVWNWAVMWTLCGLMGRGMRNRWAWLLLVWAGAHTLEHTYLFIRYLQVLDDLQRMGVTSVPAQGLPGILGADGWLARSPVTQGTFLSRLPIITMESRLDVHFWWNVGEMTFLLLATNTHLRRIMPRAIQARAPERVLAGVNPNPIGE